MLLVFKMLYRAFRIGLVRFSFIVTLLLLCMCYSLSGQDIKKRTLTEKEYHLWHTVQMDKISDDGHWVSYKLIYENTDTLFVQHTGTKKGFRFAKGHNSAFSKDYFVCIDNHNTLYQLNLKTTEIKTFETVKSYRLIDNFLLVLETGTKSGVLTIYNPKGEKVYLADEVNDYAVSPDKSQVAISQGSLTGFKVVIISLNRGMDASVIHQNTEKAYQKLVWSKNGDVLVFLSVKETKGAVFYYSREKGLKVLDCSDKDCFQGNRYIQSDWSPTLSDDNSRVFFTVQNKKRAIPQDESTVQVWNAADKWMYPREKEIEGWTLIPMQVSWEPESDKITEITTNNLPFGGAVGKREFALTFNPKKYEPQLKGVADRDIYLTNFKTGQTKLLLEKQDGSDFHLLVSPQGRYVAYFRYGKWFAYDTENDIHLELTKGMAVTFAETNSDRLGEPDAYRTPGWTTGEDSMLLYDAFDIWQVYPNGKKPKRLTNGRENGMVFRIIPQNSTERSSVKNWINVSGSFNLEQPLLLSATSSDYIQTGYYSLSVKGLHKICYQPKKTTNVLQTPDRKITVWTEESFNCPQQIRISENGRIKILFKSNPQHHKFYWGKVEKLSFQSSQGKDISGILYYPAEFIAGNKYPMVVNVYEKQSKKIHQYTNPTLYNGDGFNIANLCAEGYFVFLADIVFDATDVGFSAMACVEAGVKKVLTNGHVDSKRIGIIGHSFGGYETDFIITQSNRFACAVSGAAVTNLVSANHGVDRNVNTPSFFKIENGQYRIGASLFQKREYYIRNSPVFSADTVNTPLLAWTGLEDTQVETSQSFEFYMALRRLGKPHILLAYANEGHEIMNKTNTADLTQKIQSWFNHYLKGAPQSNWMQPN